MTSIPHSKKRFQERILIDKKYSDEHFKHALENGIWRDQFSKGSAFRKYLNKKQSAHSDKELLVYGHYIYAVRDNKIITVYPAPVRFHNFLSTCH